MKNRNSKLEIRNKYEIRNSNLQNDRFRLEFGVSCFGLVSDFGFRISDFSWRFAAR
jgi:hypothetical protein